jgi:chromosome segregation ATPase
VKSVDKELIKALNELLDDKLTPINQKLDEHTQILRALEHSAQVSNAEHDKMTNDIAHIKGDIEALRKDVSTVEIVTANNYADLAKLKAVK